MKLKLTAKKMYHGRLTAKAPTGSTVVQQKAKFVDDRPTDRPTDQ
jgi:hypothetical protein